MNENKALVWCAWALVAMIGAGAVAGVQCEKVKQETIRACVSAGKDPSACANAAGGIGR